MYFDEEKLEEQEILYEISKAVKLLEEAMILKTNPDIKHYEIREKVRCPECGQETIVKMTVKTKPSMSTNVYCEESSYSCCGKSLNNQIQEKADMHEMEALSALEEDYDTY